MPFQGWLAATYDSPKDVKMAFPFFSILLRCRLHVTSLDSLISIFFSFRALLFMGFPSRVGFHQTSPGLEDASQMSRATPLS